VGVGRERGSRTGGAVDRGVWSHRHLPTRLAPDVADHRAHPRLGLFVQRVVRTQRHHEREGVRVVSELRSRLPEQTAEGPEHMGQVDLATRLEADGVVAAIAPAVYVHVVVLPSVQKLHALRHRAYATSHDVEPGRYREAELRCARMCFLVFIIL
jgi:hypothetical protein